MTYNKEKVKLFHKYTLEDYNRSLSVEDIAHVEKTEKTDGSFIQIGIRPLLEDDIFIDPGFSEYLPGAGMEVAIGERNFLINQILENKEVQRVELREDVKEFPKYLEFNEATILLSTKFYIEVFTKFMHRIDYKGKNPRLDHEHKIIVVPESVLDNKIIILDKNAVFWKKQLFFNELTGIKETLDITIKPADIGKVDITLRSVNKISRLNPELIKIIEVKNGN